MGREMVGRAQRGFLSDLDDPRAVLALRRGVQDMAPRAGLESEFAELVGPTFQLCTINEVIAA